MTVQRCQYLVVHTLCYLVAHSRLDLLIHVVANSLPQRISLWLREFDYDLHESSYFHRTEQTEESYTRRRWMQWNHDIYICTSRHPWKTCPHIERPWEAEALT